MRRTILLLGCLWILQTVGFAGGTGPDGALEAGLLKSLDTGALRPATLAVALADPDPVIRRRAVQVLAVTGNSTGVAALRRFLKDPDPSVQSEVMLAAGRIGAGAENLVEAGLASPSAEVRRGAVWAAAQMGPRMASRLVSALGRERDRAVLIMGLANLWRLPDGTWESFAAGRAGSSDAGIRRAAAASLARSGGALSRSALYALAADEDPVVRATAARGLGNGRPGERDLEVLAACLQDADWRVVAAACLALGRRSDLKLTPEIGGRVVAAVDPERVQLEAAALSALAAHPEANAGDLLLEVAEGPESWPAGEAMVALARRHDRRAVALAAKWLADGEEWRRRAAARACVYLDGTEGDRLRRRITSSDDATIQLPWLEESKRAELVPKPQLLRELLTAKDAPVRAQVIDLLTHTKKPLQFFDLLTRAAAWRGDVMPDARAAAYRVALLATGDASRRAAVMNVARKGEDWSVMASVVAAERKHGIPALLPPRPPRHPDAWYRDLAAWMHTPRWLDLKTVRGTVRIRLDTETAPITSREIWDLAAAGFYDGLTFHRVVPDFVVQGGDPRGDGWGGPGFVLADEPSLEDFGAWRVGIATSGPNTGGCQLFVTLLPADRLTGHYTNFGTVIAGREAALRLAVGDRIRSVATASGSEPPPPVPFLIGKLTWSQLAKIEGWAAARDAYVPDAGMIERLKSSHGRYRIVAVLGSWCSDSRREIPHLEKVLAEVGERPFTLDLFGVDRTLRVNDPGFPSGLLADGKAERVPTIIVLDRDGQELGRVVETAEMPLEDLLVQFIAPEEGW